MAQRKKLASNLGVDFTGGLNRSRTTAGVVDSTGISPVVEAGLKEFGCVECNVTTMPRLLKAPG
jgi:hypothetical protein